MISRRSVSRVTAGPRHKPNSNLKRPFILMTSHQSASDSLSDETIVIAPGESGKRYWSNLWHYRELFFFLAWRDILVRYKQTIIGVLWAVIRPLATMLVFVFVFGKLARLPSEESAPYPLLVLAAMLPWQLFSSVFSDASGSLISNSAMISKIYFPRIVVPAATLVTNLVDFLISLCIFFVMLFLYGVAPTMNLLFLPFFLAIVCCAALGAGLWFASLNVKYRDFRYVIPFVVQFGLYLSPVGYSVNIVPQVWASVYALNPMVGVIGGFRWTLLGQASAPDAMMVGSATLVSLLLLFSGIAYFRKTERQFADVI